MFYCSLKEVYGPTSAGSSLLFSADGTKLISEKIKILETWTEHFDGVLNRSSSIYAKAIEQLPQVPVNESLDVTPNLGEVQLAIHQLRTWIWLNSCGNLLGGWISTDG